MNVEDLLSRDSLLQRTFRPLSLLVIALGIVGVMEAWDLLRNPETEHNHRIVRELVLSRSFEKSLNTRADCEAQGGKWDQSDRLSWNGNPDLGFCWLMASDATKACRSSDECQSFCARSVAQGEGLLGDTVIGKCLPWRNAGRGNLQFTAMEGGKEFFALRLDRTVIDVGEGKDWHVERAEPSIEFRMIRRRLSAGNRDPVGPTREDLHPLPWHRLQ